MHSQQMKQVYVKKYPTKTIIVIANLLIPGEVGKVGGLPCPINIDPISFKTVYP